MKCSPFSKGFRKGGKHMHRHRGKFMKHLMRRCMDGYGSSSSSSSDEDRHRNQSESDNCRQQRREHDHGNPNHDIDGGMHGMRHGHGMMHRMRHGRGMRHGHGMMHRIGHGHGMRHGHAMMHRMRHGHEMMHDHGSKHHGMRHHGHWHGMKHGKGHGHGMEHRMRHHHGMKHKMDHGHGRKHKKGQGPGMQHKLRYEEENSFSANQSEDIPLDVDIENQQSSESDGYTFYKPKTNAQVVNENSIFKIILETSHYQPEEVAAKITNGKIDVSAMHESMEDDVYEFHEMYRSFNIPNNVNPEVITARLDAEGKLIIEAECNDQEKSSPTERDVPIIRVSE